MYRYSHDAVNASLPRASTPPQEPRFFLQIVCRLIPLFGAQYFQEQIKVKNTTVPVPGQVYRQARVRAAKCNTSVSFVGKYPLETLSGIQRTMQALSDIKSSLEMLEMHRI